VVDQFSIIQDRLDPDKVYPYADHVLIKRHVNEESKGGILIVNGEKSECCYGEVLRVGGGWTAEATGEVFPPELKPGDWTVSMDYIGEKVKDGVNLVNYKLIRDHGIWAKVKVDRTELGGIRLVDIDPYENKLLVRITEELKTAGGVLLSDNHQLRGYTMATVIKVGPGKRDRKTGFRYKIEAKPGDRVCMLRYAGAIVKLDHENLRLIEDTDIHYIEVKK